MINSKKGRKINKLNLLLSFIIALSGWIYVVYNVNPTMTRTYTNIPVEFTNEDILMANGLAISNVDIETIDVKVEGKRSVLDDIDERISVTADVVDAGKGDNVLALNVTVPNDAKVVSKSSDNVTVTVENLKSKTVEVVPRVVSADDKSSNEPMIVGQSDQEVTVFGAESLVDKVARVECSIDGAQVLDTEKNFTVTPLPVNRNSAAIKYVKTDPDTVIITVMNGSTKKVKLNLYVENPDDEDYLRTYKGPDTVVLKGSPESLANVETIDTEIINISEIYKTEDVDIRYILPEGVEISAASLNDKLHVTVTKYELREITIRSENVKVSGVADGFNASVEENAIVVVKGKVDGIASFKPEEFKVSVDISGYMESGEYEVPAILETTVPMANLKKSTIRVKLKSSEGEN